MSFGKQFEVSQQGRWASGSWTRPIWLPRRAIRNTGRSSFTCSRVLEHHSSLHVHVDAQDEDSTLSDAALPRKENAGVIHVLVATHTSQLISSCQSPADDVSSQSHKPWWSHHSGQSIVGLGILCFIHYQAHGIPSPPATPSSQHEHKQYRRSYNKTIITRHSQPQCGQVGKQGKDFDTTEDTISPIIASCSLWLQVETFNGYFVGWPRPWHPRERRPTSRSWHFSNAVLHAVVRQLRNIISILNLFCMSIGQHYPQSPSVRSYQHVLFIHHLSRWPCWIDFWK